MTSTPEDNRKSDTQEDWRVLWQLSTRDIAFFKSQQWLVAYYALLLYAAMLGVFKLIREPSQFERWLLVAFTVADFGLAIYLLGNLQSALEAARDATSAAQAKISGEVRDKLEELEKKYEERRRPDVYGFLAAALVAGGFITILLLLHRL